MQQKIVIKIKFRCKKCRSKAMTIAAMTSGVVSVKLEGDEKDRVVVIGDEVDAVGMIILLRKKVGHATLELVAELID
ncbi:heavy metal-associated isoprenylated plant protein 47 [Salvia miltiorrhiza]|uniref:heavy metal-associated isoprenylated plant protein 47 n=1 Tax=Salvia miltiorrhiza TaxID=226208 RepID=UPI0025AB9257|nr:heavy metal-associated isoprenylated plant protein 47 [Salvia miltiorrhiza]